MHTFRAIPHQDGRLAETYRIAEALLRDGKAAEAVSYVNAIRRRAAKPGQEAAMEVTAADLDLEFILDERGASSPVRASAGSIWHGPTSSSIV